MPFRSAPEPGTGVIHTGRVALAISLTGRRTELYLLLTNDSAVPLIVSEDDFTFTSMSTRHPLSFQFPGGSLDRTSGAHETTIAPGSALRTPLFVGGPPDDIVATWRIKGVLGTVSLPVLTPAPLPIATLAPGVCYAPPPTPLSAPPPTVTPLTAYQVHVTATPQQGTAPLTVTFSATLSGPSNIPCAARMWDFGDGAFGGASPNCAAGNPNLPTATPAPVRLYDEITHTYQRQGTYRVMLQLSGAGGEISASVTVTVA